MELQPLEAEQCLLESSMQEKRRVERVMGELVKSCREVNVEAEVVVEWSRAALRLRLRLSGRERRLRLRRRLCLSWRLRKRACSREGWSGHGRHIDRQGQRWRRRGRHGRLAGSWNASLRTGRLNDKQAHNEK